MPKKEDLQPQSVSLDGLKNSAVKLFERIQMAGRKPFMLRDAVFTIIQDTGLEIDEIYSVIRRETSLSLTDMHHIEEKLREESYISMIADSRSRKTLVTFGIIEEELKREGKDFSVEEEKRLQSFVRERIEPYRVAYSTGQFTNR